MKKEKGLIGAAEKAGFLAFSAAINIVFNFWNIFYLVFLTNVLRIPMATAGNMLLFGIIWDGVNDPLIGYLCSNHTFKSGEKIRPYLVWSSIPWAVLLVIMFTDLRLEAPWNSVAAVAIYFVFEIFSTMMDVAYYSMGTVASADDSDRKVINSFRSLGAGIGSGIGSVAVYPLVELFGGLRGEDAIIGAADARALSATAAVMGLICVAGALFQYFTTEERVRVSEEDSTDRISFSESVRMLFGCRSWVRNMIYVTCYSVSNCLIMNMVNYYAAYVLGSSDSATPILAAYLVMNLVTAVLAPRIDTKLGRKRTMILAAVILIAGKIPFIIRPRAAACMYVNALTMGIGATLSYVSFSTNRNNISDIIEIQNRRRMDSMVSSADNFATKVGNALVTEIIAVSMAAAGFDESLLGAQTPRTVSTICGLMGWAPLAIAVIMLLTVRKLDTGKEREESLAAAGADHSKEA